MMPALIVVIIVYIVLSNILPPILRRRRFKKRQSMSIEDLADLYGREVDFRKFTNAWNKVSKSLYVSSDKLRPSDRFKVELKNDPFFPFYMLNEELEYLLYSINAEECKASVKMDSVSDAVDFIVKWDKTL